MENALPLFGVAAVVLAVTLTIRVVADVWLRARQLERGRGQESAGAPLAGAAGIEARLAQIEGAVDTIAVEVERIAEAQRFSAKLLGERQPAAPARRDGAAPDRG